MAYTLTEAQNVLSAFASVFANATRDLISLKEELALLQADLQSVITSNTSAEIVATKSQVVNTKRLAVSNAALYIKMLSTARTRAQAVLDISNALM